MILVTLGAVALTQDSPEWSSSGGLTCAQEKFLAEYYKGSSFNYLSSSKCEEKQENSNSLLRDSLPEGMERENFSVRWTGEFFFEDKTYMFKAESDDGIRVWLDGNLIINEWRLQDEPARYRVIHSLEKGYHAIKIEYFNGSGKAVANFSWKPHKPKIRIFGTF